MLCPHRSEVCAHAGSDLWRTATRLSKISLRWRGDPSSLAAIADAPDWTDIDRWPWDGAVITMHRRGAGVVIVALALGQLLACAPEHAPDPTPTPAFGNEAEAFAEAEEVYRAYNEALNERREGAEGADPQRYLTGLALESDIDAQNSLSTQGLRIEGTARVTSFTGESVDLRVEDSRIVGLVCIDVSGVSLINEAGVNVTPPDRGSTVAQRVDFVGSKQSLVISLEAMAETTTC